MLYSETLMMRFPPRPRTFKVSQ